MRRIRAGAAFVVMLAMLGLMTQSASASSVATYKIWHWNVAGHAIHKGSTTDGMVSAMRGSISYRKPDFVSVNEMCNSQYRAMITELRKAGYPQDPANFARFETLRTGNVCGGTAYGIALFSRQPLGTATRHTLPYDGSDKQRKLLCAPLKAQPKVKFCTTHLTIVSEYKKPQLQAVHNVLEGFRTKGDTVMVAGDFNLFPNTALFDDWYTSSVNTPSNRNNRGAYHELDDQEPLCPGWGEATTEKGSISPYACGQHWRLDLTFAPADRLLSYSSDAHPIGSICGAARDQPCSDHRIVTSVAKVTIG